MRRTAKRITAFVLAMLMVVSLTDWGSLSVHAETVPTEQNQQVSAAGLALQVEADGVTYTDGGDITDTGLDLYDVTTDTRYTAGSGTVTYIVGTHTLTMENATITGGRAINAYGDMASIYSAEDLNLVVKGENTVGGAALNAARFAGSYAICVVSDTYDTGSLTISGSGSLTATSGTADAGAYGIYAWKDILIEGTDTLNVAAEGKDNVGKKGSFGIYAENGSFTLNSGKLTAKGSLANRSYGMYGNAGVNINGGTLITEGKNYGIGMYSGSINITGGTVKATVGEDGDVFSAAPTIDLGDAADYRWRTTGDGAWQNEVVDPYINEGQTYVEIEPMTAYDLWVGGTQVTPSNRTDVLGAGDGAGATVTYIPASGAAAAGLTLDNCSQTELADNSNHAALCVAEDLNLQLEGENSLALTGSSAASYGIQTVGENRTLTIGGNGSLKVDSGAAASSYNSYGIAAMDGNSQLIITDRAMVHLIAGESTAESMGVSSAQVVIAGGALTSEGKTYAMHHQITSPFQNYVPLVYAGENESAAKEAGLVENPLELEAYKDSKYISITQMVSTTPVAKTATVAKSSQSQSGVAFALATAIAGTYKVYGPDAATSQATDVTASLSGTTLTLSHGSDLPAGTYYVTVTETGKLESEQLALTVTAYEAPPTDNEPPATLEPKVVQDETYVQGKTKYKVTNANTDGSGTVTVTGTTSKKITSVSIGSTVTVNGVTLKVTKIASNAYKGCTKLKKVTIGANVSSIGSKAFYGCKNLKSITIKTTKLTKKKVGNRAFKGINAKATIKVPKSKLKSYKSILKAKGVGSKAKIKK